MRITSLAIFCLLMSGLAQADYDSDVAAMKKGMPKAVQSFIDRQVQCTHWGNEEAYDEARQKEINAAGEKLQCRTLETDEVNLKGQYKSKPKVIKAINKAKEFY